jgi:hypothetical protein
MVGAGRSVSCDASPYFWNGTGVVAVRVRWRDDCTIVSEAAGWHSPVLAESIRRPTSAGMDRATGKFPLSMFLACCSSLEMEACSLLLLPHVQLQSWKNERKRRVL